MNSTMVFTLKDLLMFVLWGALVTLLVYLILIFRRALLTVKQINLLVEEQRKNIDATMAVVPSLTKNIDDISGEVAHDIQAFRGTVDNIAETTESVTGTINENKGFVDGLSSFMHTVSIGKVLYDKYFSKPVQDVKDASNDVYDTVHPSAEQPDESAPEANA